MAFLTLFGVELRKQYRLLVSYYVDTLIQQAIYVVAFIMLSGIVGLVTEVEFDQDQQLSFLIGYIVWWVASTCIRELSSSIAKEARWGTLEQMQLTGMSPNTIFMAKSSAFIVYYASLACGVVVLFTLLFQLPLWMLFKPLLLIFYGLTLAGIMGLGLIITGLHIVYKNVSTFARVFSFVSFPLCGVMAPIQAGGFLYVFSRFLPLTSGVELMRWLVFADSTTLPMPELFFFLVNTLVYVVGGIYAINWALQRAQRAGSLAHY